MIEPTVGRLVHYRAAGTDPAAQPHVAIVCFVNNPRSVNLMVLNEIGNMYHAPSATLLQDDDQPPVGAGYAEWMRFQKGQAGKTEAAIAAAMPDTGALEKAIDAKLQELGEWMVKKFAEIDARLASPAPAPAFIHVDPPGAPPAPAA